MVRRLRELKRVEAQQRAMVLMVGTRTRLLEAGFSDWNENRMVAKLRGQSALGRLGAMLTRGPLLKTTVAWRVAVHGDYDGSAEWGQESMLRRRRRKEREAAAAGALSLDARIAVVMASHQRLGRASPLYAIRNHVHIWSEPPPRPKEGPVLVEGRGVRELASARWKGRLVQGGKGG
jgi:hypothetical protein